MGRCNRGVITMAVVILIWSVPSAVMGDIYRYVDARGVIHFTNRPSSGRYRLFMREVRRGVQVSNMQCPLSFDPLVQKAAKRYGVEIPLIKAIIKAESDFDPGAVSGKGARGLMQLMPERAQRLGVRNCLNPAENIDGGVRHLRALLDHFKGRVSLALAAYNAGRDAVTRHGGVPPYPETQVYVQRVLEYYAIYRRNERY
jgi:soluble lytic murein transglycosylase-like protein